MAKVTLIDYTGKGHPDPLYAGRLLAYTKNTRMNMTPEGLEKFMTKPAQEILDELTYMSRSIPSSWEFADVVFQINGVSRAIAQQITRTRNASYAMQSQRVTDMSEVTFDDIKHNDPLVVAAHKKHMNDGIHNYIEEVKLGVPLEDARDLLPIGVHTNLLDKYNLRALVDLIRARESLRVQGAYVDIVRQMKEQVSRVWPWAQIFFEPKDQKAISMIEEVALELRKQEGAQGAFYQGLSGRLAKAADLLKK